RQVSVIAAFGSAAFAAKAATTAIPIVFGVPEDPVRLGLVPSLAQPGGNVTGINWVTGELVAKRLELLHQLTAAARVAVLADAAAPKTTLREVTVAPRAMGLQIQLLNASTSREINAVFATFARERPDAIFVASDPLFQTRRVQFAALTAHHAIPAIYSSRDY